MDVFGASGAAVRLYVSANIMSVRTIYLSSTLCLVPPPSDFAWVNQGVKVELYTGLNATGAKIGEVSYWHLASRTVQDGQIYNYPNGLLIGYLGTEQCTDVNLCSCYPVYFDLKHHVHMTRSDNGVTVYRNCYTGVDPSSPIYYWPLP